MDLKAWTAIYLKQRDLLRKDIISLHENDQGFTLTTRGGERKVVVHETLEPHDADMIVCLNTEENVRGLAKDWQRYAKQDRLVIVFANPESNEKWLIRPHHHDKVADKASLRQGLLSMHGAVPAA